MSISIRPATSADVPFLAHILDLAARSHVTTGLYDYLFEQPPEAIRAFATTLLQTQTQSWAHYSSYLVAEWNGEPAAALAGYDEATRGLMIFLAAIQEAMTTDGWAEEAQAAVWQRLSVLEPGFPPDIPGAWVIESVATLPAYRRRGLVAALMQRVLEDGRAQGHTVAQLTLLIGNTPAQRAYEQIGFQVTTERRDPAFEAALGAPGLAQMTRALAPTAELAP